MKKQPVTRLKQKKNPIAQLHSAANKALAVIGTHTVLIIFVIAGAAIGMALVRARGYLNPIRDENRYNQAVSKNTYSKINYTLVNKLQASLSSNDVKVNQSLSPNRNNPFAEP